MKRVVRGLGIFVGTLLYALLLLVNAALLSTRLTVYQPATVKDWLNRSGSYEQVAQTLSRDAKVTDPGDEGSIQFTSEEIVQAAQAAFPSSDIKTGTETVVDGFYGWFSGKTTGPDYRVDVTKNKEAFAAALTTTLEAKLKELPECPASVKPSTGDILSFTCVAKNASLVKPLTDFEETIKQSDSFLPNTVLSGGDIKVDGERIGAAYPWVTSVYATLGWLPWVTTGVVVAIPLLALLLSKQRRRTARHFVLPLLIIGAALTLVSFIGPRLNARVLSWVAEPNSSAAAKATELITPILDEVQHSLGGVGRIIGAAYALAAIVLLGLSFLIRSKHHSDEPAEVAQEQPVPAEELTPQSTAPTYVNDVAPPSPQPTPPAPSTTPPTPPAQPPLPTPTPDAPTPLTPPAPQVGGPLAPRINPSAPRREFQRRPPMIQG